MPYAIPAPFGVTVPLDALHVWQWAKTVPRADVCPVKYLQSLGFVVGTDRCTEGEYQILEYACDAYQRTAPHIATPMAFVDAFTQVPSGGFYVQGMDGRYVPNPAIVQALIGAGWIYDVEPDTTFFAVINGRLFAKYQQILGSRCLVELKGA